MQVSTRILLGAAVVFAFTACLFKDPIFTEGFSKIDPELGGVWVEEGKSGDPRRLEFVVCAPLDDDRFLVNYPAGGKDGIYYEARPMKIHEHSVLQLRVLAAFGDGLPKADAKLYTLLWIEKDNAGATMRIRALDGSRLKDKEAAAVRSLIEAKSADWNKLFGDSMVFRRLKAD